MFFRQSGVYIMKKEKSKYLGICIWLAIIAFLLLCGVVLFAAYVYKFDPLSLVSALFQTDANVIWSALDVIVTGLVGVFTIIVSVKLAKMQEGQARIEEQQHSLYTEPHILIDALSICPAECELTSDGKAIKTIKDVNYPYYVNKLEDNHLTDFSVITVTFVNTSEAFARLRFDKAVIKHSDDDIVASYNISTFGAHRNHVILKSGASGQIGLIIRNSSLSKLRGTKLTISTYLDNNFSECFWDEQSYHISDQCEGVVTFMPYDVSKNIHKKIER